MAEVVASPEMIRAITATLTERCGLDLTGYRETTLARRIQLHIHASGAESADAYLNRLRDDAAESARLIARITIKTSGFFRDVATFEALRSYLKRPAARVWSAGCGNGEEPYSLAMLLAESSTSACPEIVPAQPLVLATDLDEAGLTAAKAGFYASHVLQNVTSERLAMHFEPVRRGRQLAWCVRPSLRAAVRFVQHDLASSFAPEGGPFDVILCRNVLIYWSRPLQERMQCLLVESLAPEGILCLGPAEWPAPEVARNLRIVDVHNRLFQRAETGSTEVANARA